MPSISLAPHPLLDLRAFLTEFPRALDDTESDHDLQQLFNAGAAAPLQSDDDVRTAVRDLLRYGGFKPTGRSKPASEYLLRASSEGRLSTINLAVDVCNVVSLHSGLPISVIDLDLASEPLRVEVAPHGSEYVFNQTGQVIQLDGLLCLFDAEGPCANAVKDSQRTKTGPETRRTLSLIWGTNSLPGRAEMTEAWYHQLLISRGAQIQSAPIAA